MRTLIKETTIVTGNEQREILYNAGIAIQDTEIVGIGSSDDLEREFSSSTMVQGRGKVIFPGLINCHTHLQATADRGILEDFGFPTTLGFPTTGRGLLSPDERKIFALLASIEAIKSGTTTLLEISENIHEYAHSLNSTGLRLLLAENINDIDTAGSHSDFSESKRDDALRRASDLIESWHNKSDGRIKGFVAPHAPETVSPELLRASKDLAEKHNVGYTIHLSQSYQEIMAVKETRGVLPTHYLFANEFLGNRLVVAHCRYLNNSEIALLGEAKVNISHNSAIGARRGAAAPIRELSSSGCTIGMGTDNMAEDMVAVMRAGLFHERVRLNSETHPQPEDVLQWATFGGATALGISDDVGSLEIGKKADFFIIDSRKAHLVPTLRIVSSFVHNGSAGDITDVMIDGKWVMRDSSLTTIDEMTVISNAEKIGHRVWNKLVNDHPNVHFPIKLPPTTL